MIWDLDPRFGESGTSEFRIAPQKWPSLRGVGASCPVRASVSGIQSTEAGNSYLAVAAYFEGDETLCATSATEDDPIFAHEFLHGSTR